MAAKKIPQNTKKDHDDAVAGDDPTQIPAPEDLAKEAIKKFKSLG